jgi:hypothetical protein
VFELAADDVQEGGLALTVSAKQTNAISTFDM